MVVKDFLVVKLLNNQFPKSNNQKHLLLRVAVDLSISCVSNERDLAAAAGSGVSGRYVFC